MTCLPISPIEGLTTVELTPARSALLQEFFNENPAYFIATSGAPAGPDEAIEEITSEVPADWGYTKKWVVGYRDAHGRLAAMANIITDLLATSVFHIGTFIVATSRHGSGDAQSLYRRLEHWSRDNGAAWMRLGVVVGNIRAERFWTSLGYMTLRRREGVGMGRRTVAIQTMVKPLSSEPLARYLELVARDRPVE